MAQTEFSYFWDGLTIGDALLGAHSSEVMASLWAVMFQENDTSQGVIETNHASFSSQLAVINPAGNNIRVQDGAAIVKGRIYTNTANVDVVIETPTIATRIDRSIIRMDFQAQTIRTVLITGFSGAGVPTLQQDTVIWEIPLAQISITIGGVITITDERVMARTKLKPDIKETFTIIDEFVSTGIELSAEFSNIPQTFKDILILGMCRHIDNTGVGGETEWATLGIRFNNDTDPVYHSMATFIRISSGGAQTKNTVAVFNQTEVNGYYIATNDAPANHFSPVILEIPDYTDTDFYKTGRMDIGVWGGAAGRPSALHNVGFTYKKVTNITKIEIFNPDAPAIAWASGTRFVLIGIQ